MNAGMSQHPPTIFFWDIYSSSWRPAQLVKGVPRSWIPTAGFVQAKVQHEGNSLKDDVTMQAEPGRLCTTAGTMTKNIVVRGG